MTRAPVQASRTGAACRRRAARRAALLLALAFTSACAGGASRRPEQVFGIVEGVQSDAWRLLRDDRPLAALRAARAVDRLDPERGLEAALRVELPERLRDGEPPVGAVHAALEPVERPLHARVLLWLPDRLLDLLDVVGFELAVGPGLRADLHLTHAAQLALGARQTVGLGWTHPRNLGLSLRQDADGFGTHSRYLALLGTRSGLVASGGAGSDGAVARGPDAPYYRDLRDYWELGASAHLLLVGASVELHPVELWDFLGGLAGFDPRGDDTAQRVGWDPDQQTRLRLEALHEVLVHEQAREDYRAWIAARRAAEASASDG